VYTIIESAIFARKADVLLSNERREALAVYLALFPNAGVVIPGSGGLRKLRWGVNLGGKRGGLRIIYFNQPHCGQVVLITVFSKRRREGFSKKELMLFRKAFDDDN